MGRVKKWFLLNFKILKKYERFERKRKDCYIWCLKVTNPERYAKSNRNRDDGCENALRYKKLGSPSTWVHMWHVMVQSVQGVRILFALFCCRSKNWNFNFPTKIKFGKLTERALTNPWETFENCYFGWSQNPAQRPGSRRPWWLYDNVNSA